MVAFRRLVCLFLLGSTAACGDNERVPAPDASVPPLDETEHAGGVLGPMAFQDTRLFLAVGPRVQIWDVADPARPQLLGTTPAVRSVVSALAPYGRVLFIAEDIDLDGQVHVFDVGEPAAVRAVGTFRTVPAGRPSEPDGLAVDGTNLYVADHEQGVFKLDITKVTAPVELARASYPGINGVRVVGDRVFATTKNFTGTAVIVLDRDLEELGSVFGNGGTAAAPTSSGIVAFSGIDAAQIFDIRDPRAPAERFYDEQLQGYAVEATGTTAWYPMPFGLVTVDVADAEPRFHVLVDDRLTSTRRGLASGHMLALGTERGRLALVDVSAPLAPAMDSVSDVSVCTNCLTAASAGDHLFIADSAGGLRSANARDLAMTGHVLRETMVDYEDIAIAGSYAYVADWFYGLRVIDVTDPARMIETANLFTGGYPSAIAISGERAVVGTSTNGGEIHVVDIRDPRSPRKLGSAPTTKARDVVYVGDLVYVGDENLFGEPGGLRIFDVADPTRIKELTHFTHCPNVLGVAVHGTLAMLACDQQGLVVVDVSTPSRPVIVGSLDLEAEANAATAIAIDGDRVYLGTWLGLDVIDISDPSKPQRVLTRPTPASVRGITVRESGHVVVAAGPGGLFQWKL